MIKPKVERSDSYERAKPKYVMVIAIMLPLAALFITFGAALLFARIEPFSRLSMLLLLAGLLCGIPVVLSLLSAAAPQKVRVARSTPLHFVPTATAWVFGIVATVLVSLSGAMGVWAQLAPDIDEVVFGTLWRVGVWTLLPGGISLLIYVLTRIPILRGLEIDPDGLRWWRGSEEISLPWQQVYSVQLSTTGSKNTVRVVEIIDRDSRPYVLRPGQLGSDPHVVAEVLRYFVKKPKDRRILNDPRAALALVTEPLVTQPLVTEPSDGS